MELVGLTPLALGLTLLGLTAVILALYLLKNEQRKVIVPSVLFWDSLLTKRKGVAWARKLRRLLSLLLALLIAALLVLAIADPQRLNKRSDRRVIILIDASASMQATDEKPTRLARAKKEARALLKTLGGSDRALVAQLDAAVTPLTTFTDDRAALEHGIERVTSTDLAGNLSIGIAFAVDVLQGSPEAELFIVSDGNLSGIDVGARLAAENKKLKVHYVKVGKSQRNVGIEHLSVRRYPLDKMRTESIVRVRNFGDQAETLTLRLLAGTALLYEEKLSLSAQSSTVRTFADLAATSFALEARIALEKGPDALGVDDRAYAALPARTQTRVLLVTEGNRYLEAALLLDEYLDVEEVAPNAYTDTNGHDVVIFDRFMPSRAPTAPSLYLAPAPTKDRFAPFQTKGEIARPFFERVDDDHPLARSLALRDVNVGRALWLVPEREDRVIAQTARNQPLLIEGAREGVPFVALAFDVRESDLPLRVSFPLFVLAAVDRLASEQGSEAARGLVGEAFRVRVPEGVERASLTDAHRKVTNVPVRDREARFLLTQAGIYELEAGGARTMLAANVEAAQEGAIAPRDVLIAKPRPVVVGRSLGFSSAKWWPWLAAISALLLAAEWLSFHRRWTV